MSISPLPDFCFCLGWEKLLLWLVRRKLSLVSRRVTMFLTTSCGSTEGTLRWGRKRVTSREVDRVLTDYRNDLLWFLFNQIFSTHPIGSDSLESVTYRCQFTTNYISNLKLSNINFKSQWDLITSLWYQYIVGNNTYVGLICLLSTFIHLDNIYYKYFHSRHQEFLKLNSSDNSTTSFNTSKRELSGVSQYVC